VAAGVLLLSQLGRAAEVDKQFLKTLPPQEQALKDSVDHWGLPFADQLRRFLSARSSFRKALGRRSPKGFLVGIQHGLEKVPQNKYWFKGRYGTSVSLQAAGNEYESFQVAVLPEIGKGLENVRLTPGDLGKKTGQGTIPAQAISVYRVGYVKTVAARYPSLYTGWWPDCLLENAAIGIDGTDLGLFWVDIKVPAHASAGDYRGELLLAADDESVPIEVTLHVHAFQLPDRVPFPIAVWEAPRWPWGEKMTREDHRALLGEFLKHGVDPVSVGKASVSLDENDFSRLDANLEFCFARGLQLFEIPNPRKNPEKLKPLVEHLRAKGWIDKALLYSNQDEPDATQFAVRNIPFCRQLNSLYPDLRVYLASEYHPRIDRGCNIWMSDLSTGRGAAFAQANRGEAELWFYYCHLPVRIDFCRPLVQAPNMQIDNEAIEHRLALWLAWKYRTTGMFIWAGNRGWQSKDIDRRDWQERGWQLPEQPSSFPYAGIHNGNGFLIYPGPNPSIRLKIIRDGLEDYGYLMELKRRAEKSPKEKLVARARQLLSVPQTVLVDAHYFNRNPAGLLKARNEIARLIDDLAP